MKAINPRLVCVLAGLSLAVLSGCLLGTSNDVIVTGKNISGETFAQVEPGKTKEFVLSLLGQPSEKIKEDNGELWKWHYSERRNSDSGFIFIFATHNVARTEKTNFVEFKNDVVSRVWSE